ncbi:class I SAM-dependent methyltransferase [Candidatus Woesebacteria bacterium]|nr:MAG: class I SAM-dependent methyltransferase [Candidatus Woesebacteria bacterium]
MVSYSKIYLKNKPLFISVIRSKEAKLFVPGLPYKRPVLDFGCGDGFYAKTVVYPTQGKIDCGVDVAEKVLTYANESKAYRKVICYDGVKLPFPKNTFSTVFSNCVLEHVVYLESNLHEIHRVLKPNGKFYCTVMTNKWEDYLAGNVLSKDYYGKWMRRVQVHVQLPDYNAWCRLFKASGFTINSSIGYMDKRASWWMDFLHYISIPNLMTYKLFKKWVLFPGVFDILPVYKFIDNLSQKSVSLSKAAAIYFELEKH